MRLTDDQLAAVRSGDPAALRALGPTLRKCARAGCIRAGAEHLSADVEQDLWLFLLGSGGQRLDTSYNIEPWLIESARRIALALIRKLSPVEEVELEDELTQEERVINANVIHDVSDSLNMSIDRENALKYLRKKSNTLSTLFLQERSESMPGSAYVSTERVPHFVVNDPVQQHREIPNIGQSPRRTAATPKTPDSEELRRIRTKLRLSQAEMAARLFLKIPTYQAYEYGRVRAVPKEVMDNARRLLLDDDFSVLREKFSGKKMSEIAKEWAQRIGVDPNYVSEFARVLVVNKSTISRWMKDLTDPDPYDLIKYENRVIELEKMREREKAIR